MCARFAATNIKARYQGEVSSTFSDIFFQDNTIESNTKIMANLGLARPVKLAYEATLH
jgi:hypothetical protein